MEAGSRSYSLVALIVIGSELELLLGTKHNLQNVKFNYSYCRLCLTSKKEKQIDKLKMRQ